MKHKPKIIEKLILQPMENQSTVAYYTKGVNLTIQKPLPFQDN